MGKNALQSLSYSRNFATKSFNNIEQCSYHIKLYKNPSMPSKTYSTASINCIDIYILIYQLSIEIYLFLWFEHPQIY